MITFPLFSSHPSTWSRVRSVLLIMLLSLGFGCSSPIRNPSPEDLTPSMPQGLNWTVRHVKTLEQQAREDAKKWQPDAILVSVTVNALVMGSATPFPMADLLSFEFRSNQDSHTSHIVGFLMNDTIKVREPPLTNPNFDYNPIEPTDWVLDSTDAWQIAQQNGGSDFLKRNELSGARVVLKLGRSLPPRNGDVLWYVAYGAQQGRDSLQMYIDAKTGAIIQKNN